MKFTSSATDQAGGDEPRSAKSSALTCAIGSRAARSTAGYLGLIALSVAATTAAVASRVNHLWSSGTTYQGAHCALV